MRSIIAGSRGIADFDIVQEAIFLSGFEVTEVVSGTARGVDSLGELWAKCHNVPVKRFPAAWDKYGKSAGHKRNGQMAEYADALIAISLHNSPGTRSMISLARLRLLEVYVYTC